MIQASKSFALLDERVQRWVWKQGWPSLRSIQERAIPIVLAAKSDVIISASTAGGKTEAVFLPVLTSILNNGKSSGYQVLYISPLKALINDQYKRLCNMTEGMDIDVIPWHGDISLSQKYRSLKNPNGILIITPESLESFLINRPGLLSNAFSSLQYLVIDELHSFIGTERGKQLQSLMSRLELITKRPVPRIAMSATFSSYDIVKAFLRNNQAFPCKIPIPEDKNHETLILVKEFIPLKKCDIDHIITKDIYRNLRGSTNLVFTNDRGTAEKYTLMLSDMCRKDNVPNEFRVHHSYISKTEREYVEHELQKHEYPVTAICTSTLELGIDVGKVQSIAQVGTIMSVAGLRQRLGRSGRRNEPSILRVYSKESERRKSILFGLRNSLVENIATIELMRNHQYESPSLNCYHFSTLIQQILSIIAQYGGFYPKDGWTMLCRNGAFKNITPQLFLSLLKDLGKENVITQLHTGQIIVDITGEQILRSSDFYTAFITHREYIVINKSDSYNIGKIQYNPQIEIGKIIILSGQRWRIEYIDKTTLTIYVINTSSDGDPVFYGNSKDTDSIVVKKMLEIYQTDIEYPYLDDKTGAKEHLKRAREFFINYNLMKTSYIQYGEDSYLFTWAGSKINRTIALLAKYVLQKDCYPNALYILNLTYEDIKDISNKFCDNFNFISLLTREDKIFQKYDYLLSDELLNLEYINTHLDIRGAKILLKYLTEKDSIKE